MCSLAWMCTGGFGLTLRCIHDMVRSLYCCNLHRLSSQSDLQVIARASTDQRREQDRGAVERCSQRKLTDTDGVWSKDGKQTLNSSETEEHRVLRSASAHAWDRWRRRQQLGPRCSLMNNRPDHIRKQPRIKTPCRPPRVLRRLFQLRGHPSR